MKKTSQEWEKTKIELKEWYEELLSPKKDGRSKHSRKKSPGRKSLFIPHIALKEPKDNW